MRYLVILITLLAATSAEAFHYRSDFSNHPYTRVYGAGGNYYTGSPRSYNMDCGSCHTGSSEVPLSERATLDVTVKRLGTGSWDESYDLFGSGYVNGEQYRITVTMQNETRGRMGFIPTGETGQIIPELGDEGQLPDAGGTSAWKAACSPVWSQPPTGSERWTGVFAGNRDHVTAEVMSESGDYANYTGNGAGKLLSDSAGSGPCSGGSCCLNGSNYCGGGQYSANLSEPSYDAGITKPDLAQLTSGPTTAMFKNWRLDPQSNPPLGTWACDQNCDAIVSNNIVMNWFNEVSNPVEKQFRFFWTAPSDGVVGVDGRIRFYMAAVDADGYFDIFDDYVALRKLAICREGSAAGCSDVGAGWGVMAPPSSGGNSGLFDFAPWLVSLFLLGSLMALALVLAGIRFPTRRWAV